MDLVCQKGFFPYEWLDSFERLNHRGLPPLKDFYSSLTKGGCLGGGLPTRSEGLHLHELRELQGLHAPLLKD
jgi:hypothetical protein